jgi:hypothetical protein
MTSALVDGSGRFSNGGNVTHWPYGEGMIEYCKIDDSDPEAPQISAVGRCTGTVFAPEVLAPPGTAAAKDTPLALSLRKIRVYSPTGGDEEFGLPLPWVGKTISVRAIGAGVAAPAVAVAGNKLTVTGLPKASPVVLTVA